jgi:hypothetical protein
MTQTSYPFENIDTTETQFSRWARNFQESGVKGVPGDSNLTVTADDSILEVEVQPGQAFIRGHYYENTAPVRVTLETTGSQVRIDAIVLELDPESDVIEVKVVPGDPVASNPLPPELTQTDAGIYQLLLGHVAVPVAGVAISSSMVTDLRSFMSGRVGLWTTGTRPDAPYPGQAGFNSQVGKIEVWNGTSWGAVGGAFAVSTTPPDNPQQGDTWFDPTDGTAYIYYVDTDSAQWIAIAPAGGGGSDSFTNLFLLMGA